MLCKSPRLSLLYRASQWLWNLFWWYMPLLSGIASCPSFSEHVTASEASLPSSRLPSFLPHSSGKMQFCWCVVVVRSLFDRWIVVRPLFDRCSVIVAFIVRSRSSLLLCFAQGLTSHQSSGEASENCELRYVCSSARLHTHTHMILHCCIVSNLPLTAVTLFLACMIVWCCILLRAVWEQHLPLPEYHSAS